MIIVQAVALVKSIDHDHIIIIMDIECTCMYVVRVIVYTVYASINEQYNVVC